MPKDARGPSTQPHALKPVHRIGTPAPVAQVQMSRDLLQRANAEPSSLTASDVLQLQRTVGNQATVGLLSKATPLQTKLKVGPARDRYEQEADSVAEQVMRQVDKPAALQRHHKEEETVQAKPALDNSRFSATQTQTQASAPLIRLEGRCVPSNQRR